MSKNKINILIVEDDQNTSDLISTVLISDGYGVFKAPKGRKAISLTADNSIDLILLDLGLPDIDGMQVLKSIREWSDIPIIIISARTEESEIVKALDAGADDYITKPLWINELLARIRRVVKTQKKINGNNETEEDSFFLGDLTIDYSRRKISKNGKSIHLTPIEYKIVVLLSKNAGKVMTHDFIITHVWGGLYESDDQVLRVNMANIRRKLEDSPSDPKYILTEVGIGYRMAEPGDTDMDHYKETT